MNKFVYYSFGFILVAIILGAFGAHAFKDILSSEKLLSYEVGVKYQMYVGIIGLILTLNQKYFERKRFKIGTILLFLGGVLFSGSIYLLTFIDTGILRKTAIPLTPLGGLCIILSMFFYGFSYYKVNKNIK